MSFIIFRASKMIYIPQNKDNAAVLYCQSYRYIHTHTWRKVKISKSVWQKLKFT